MRTSRSDGNVRYHGSDRRTMGSCGSREVADLKFLRLSADYLGRALRLESPHTSPPT